MKKQQVDISPVAYNMVISMLTKQGDVVKAFKIFNEVRLTFNQSLITIYHKYLDEEMCSTTY